MSNFAREQIRLPGLDAFLLDQPAMRLIPPKPGFVRLKGTFAFNAAPARGELIADEYLIEIWVPRDFPSGIPIVFEQAGRIPPKFHKLRDGSLCLGAPSRLRLALLQSPSLQRFAERCILPYLYGRSFFEKHNILPFGELAHGTDGILEDLADIFRVDVAAVPVLLRLASMKKRRANKLGCPCQSGRRVGRCHHLTINRLRDTLGTNWFRLVLNDLGRSTGRRPAYEVAAFTQSRQLEIMPIQTLAPAPAS